MAKYLIILLEILILSFGVVGCDGSAEGGAAMVYAVGLLYAGSHYGHGGNENPNEIYGDCGSHHHH